MPIAAHQVVYQLWLLSSLMIDSVAIAGQTLVAVQVRCACFAGLPWLLSSPMIDSVAIAGQTLVAVQVRCACCAVMLWLLSSLMIDCVARAWHACAVHALLGCAYHDSRRCTACLCGLISLYLEPYTSLCCAAGQGRHTGGESSGKPPAGSGHRGRGGASGRFLAGRAPHPRHLQQRHRQGAGCSSGTLCWAGKEVECGPARVACLAVWLPAKGLLRLGWQSPSSQACLAAAQARGGVLLRCSMVGRQGG